MNEAQHRARQKWREIVDRQAASGMSVAAYCREHQIAENGFYAWKRQLRESSSFEEGTEGAQTLVPVAKKEAASATAGVVGGKKPGRPGQSFGSSSSAGRPGGKVKAKAKTKPKTKLEAKPVRPSDVIEICVAGSHRRVRVRLRVRPGFDRGLLMELIALLEAV